MLKYTVFALIILIYSCSGIKRVVPLQEKEHEVSASLGGPLVKFSGLIVPVPLSSISWNYGLDTNLTLSSSLHTTSLLFGVGHVDISILRNIIKSNNQKYGISISPGFHYMTDFHQFKPSFFPYADLNFYRLTGTKNNPLFFSISSLFDLHSKKAFDEKNSNKIVPYITLGYQLQAKRFNYGFEVKYLNFTRSNQNIVAEYISPTKYGALGFYFTLSKKF